MAEWSELMNAPVRDLRIGGKIVFGSGQQCALDGEKVISLAIDEGTGGAIQPGSVLSAGCTLDLCNTAGQWDAGGECLGWNELMGATIMPELGVLDGGETLWRPMGVFQVESALRLEAEGILRLKASDSIVMELSAEFADGLSYPCTLADVWAHAVGQSRYSYSGAIPNGGAAVDLLPDWKGASLRTAMGQIAMAAGCFVCISRSGELELRPLWDGEASVRELDGETYLDLEADDVHYGPVDALRIECAGSDVQKLYTSGEAGLYTLQVSGNPLFRSDAAGLDGLAGGMLAAVSGLESDQLRFSWRGDPDLRIGDRASVQDLKGRVHTGIISRQTLRFDGGFSASCSCTVPEENNSGVRRAITPEGGLNAAALTGAVDGGLLRAGSVSTGKLATGSITAEKIATGALDTIILEAMIAKVESLTADDIHTDRLAAALAAFTVVTAGTADFDRATVGHLVAQALNLQFGTLDSVFINNLCVRYAQIAAAAIGSLCIRASDGNYYAIDVDANGHVSAVLATVTEEETAAGQTDAGRFILATDITADSLNTGSLLATYALINRIDAARIDVDELFARDAFIDRLTTGRIVNDKSIRMIVGDLEDMQALVRLDTDGLHVGDGTNTGEVLIDPASVNVVLNGRRYSQFAANHVQFGNYQLRQSADGGLVFKLR